MVRKINHKPDTSLLKAEEIEAVKKEAREQWEKEQRSKQRSNLLQAEKAELDRKADPDEEIVSNVRIDLPPFSDRIVIDGTIFLHGATYEFPMRQYHTIRDVMARSWDHQREVEGHKRDYNKPRGFVVSGAGDAVTSTASLMRR